MTSSAAAFQAIDVEMVLEEFQEEARTMAAVRSAECGDPSVYDDVFSDAMEGAWIAAKTFDASAGASLRTWMRFKARNSVIDGIRRRFGRTKISKKKPAGLIPIEAILHEPRSMDDPESRAVAKATVAKLLRITEDALAPLERRVLAAMLKGDLTPTEVCRKLGCGQSNVSQGYHRAVAKLRAKALRIGYVPRRWKPARKGLG